jgi:uncharacterized phage-associated protein
VDYPYDESKFREALLYVAKRLESDPAGGATKLNKVLFFAEFAHMREHGRPITGAVYQKLSWGPAPRRLKPVRDQMVADGEVALTRDSYLGYRQDRLLPLRDPNEDALSASERKALDDALNELRGMTGKQASDLSHEELGWQVVAEGETIPYEAAVLRRPVMTERIRKRAAELAADLASR